MMRIALFHVHFDAVHHILNEVKVLLLNLHLMTETWSGFSLVDCSELEIPALDIYPIELSMNHKRLRIFQRFLVSLF